MQINDSQADRVALLESLACGSINLAVGWSSFVLGIATGLVIGLWSFDGPVPVPAWIGDYADTPRRLLRLGHIAFFGLGIINILMARELPRLPVADPVRRNAFHAMNFGNFFLPLTLIGAALQPALIWVLPIPATAVFAAVCVTAFVVLVNVDGARKRPDHDERNSEGRTR